MKRILLSFLLTLLVGGCAASLNRVPIYTRTPSEITHITNATVALVTEWGDGYGIYCSGALLAGNKVLTAQHCVDGLPIGGEVLVGTYKTFLDTQGSFASGVQSFYLADYDVKNDLALLVSDPGPPVSSSRFSLARSVPNMGENVVVMGHPQGLGWSLTAGIVSNSHRVGWPDEHPDDAILFIQASAQAYYGNSGGPLLNNRNELIGIVSQGGPSHIVMCVHLDVIKEFLE